MLKLPSPPVFVAATVLFPEPISVTSAPATSAPDESTAFPAILVRRASLAGGMQIALRRVRALIQRIKKPRTGGIRGSLFPDQGGIVRGGTRTGF